MIFADLKAFTKGKSVSKLETYGDYLKSNCQLVLLIVDSSYVTLYFKDREVLEKLYLHAYENGFENIEFINNEDDTRSRLSVW